MPVMEKTVLPLTAPHNYTTSLPLALRLRLPLLLKRRHRKRPRKPRRRLERDPPQITLINIELRQSNPDQDLLALDTRQLLHPSGLDEGGDLAGVGGELADLLEVVGRGFLLAEPARGAVVADLFEVARGEEAPREVELAEELGGFWLADVEISAPSRKSTNMILKTNSTDARC
ncbi:uncharacterized protein A4U43_C01F25160 [Asparagus officinalis]|uniref:Uncharacterized protein n=1 Tax=Asparagus officinalis TaxID=4686 RepID=A0A5P1FVF1_ASPOF|nr:uncharacterized protein A4U43_C01F25160 [Asparagus officinalis]